jgi:hypothetical protein
VLWDAPEVYGVACKRVDCRERKSEYNSKRRHVAAFADLVAGVEATSPGVRIPPPPQISLRPVKDARQCHPSSLLEGWLKGVRVPAPREPGYWHASWAAC